MGCELELPALTAPVVIKASATVTCATAAVFTARPCFVYVDVASAKFGAVQRTDGAFGFAGTCHLDEGKATGLSGVTIIDYIDAFYGAEWTKRGQQVILRCPKTKVPNK